MEAERKSPKVRLRDEWLAVLGPEFDLGYMHELSRFLRGRRAAGAEIYPPARDIFRALELTPPTAARVVILGQDPYHNPGQAHGLSFSVPEGERIPPSLANIYRELETDLQLPRPSHGCLRRWAEQGVLLLNSVLTVEKNQPGSHQGYGWERFTDRIVDVLAADLQPRVFMLWGAQAQKKGGRVDAAQHCVLRAPHPSPLSAHRGFFGCRHFSAANAFLEAHGQMPIDWSPDAPAKGASAAAG